MKIYTKTGDDGTTGLFGGGRTSKDDLRIELLGQIDELNAAIGFARTQSDSEPLGHRLMRIQRELFELGAEVGCPSDSPYFKPSIGQADLARLEKEIDEAQLPPLRDFILPGGTPFAASIHVARTIARRAERQAVSARSALGIRTEPSMYLNRLSDWLFVMARLANHLAGAQDVKWKEAE
ncbi:MAG: cob(I)yrinic acid a,c-diamide adenosyltransferase [Chthonomonas sp.]|nr:cob(I)yrinic acid a,c-diamide adenosyltransferase [Chthonomonas sp.]